jgi:MoxR-like ATPase
MVTVITLDQRRQLVDVPTVRYSILFESSTHILRDIGVIQHNERCRVYFTRTDERRRKIFAAQLEPIDDVEFERRFRYLVDRVGQHLLGKNEKIELSVICLLADGHLLVEDLPGLGKTTLANGLAMAFGGQYRRVQGTPDLLPSDITGSLILNRNADSSNNQGRSDGFVVREGPVFTNVLLCDEINRTPPRTQSALLEAMEERQVTIFDETRRLPDPFFVIATQNPVELDGTYALPEAQLDRFLMRLELGYPDREVLRTIMEEVGSRRRVDESGAERPAALLTPAQLRQMIRYVNSVPVQPVVTGYIADLIEATRDPKRVVLGASPRAAIALLRAARAYAAGLGLPAAYIDHVKALAPYVLAHRIILREPPVTNLAEAQTDYIHELVRTVPTGKKATA